MGKLTLLLLAVLLSMAMRAPAAEPRIYDNAKIFSASTLHEADETIAQIKRDFDKDVVVETFEDIPESLRDQYKRQDRQEFFESWLRSRARHYQVDGVFILICRNAHRLQLEPGSKTRQKAFTLKDRDEVVKVMAANFRNNKYDDGLIAGLRLIEQRMGTNLGVAPSAPPDQGDHTTPATPSTQPSTAPATAPTTAPALP